MMTLFRLDDRPAAAQRWSRLTLCAAVPAVSVVLAIATGPLGIVAAVGAASIPVLAAVAPGIPLAAYVLIPFYKGAVQSYSPIDITIVLAAINALQLIPLAMDRRPRRVSRVGVALWAGTALLVLGGILYAPDQNLALNRATGFWALVFLPTLPAAARVASSPRYVRQFLWTILGMGCLMTIVGLGALAGAHTTGGAPLEVLGTSTISVGRAALLVPLLGVVFALREGQPLARVTTAMLAPAALLVALASGSRGPLLFLVIMAGLGLAWHLARRRAIQWRHVSLIAGLALASLLVVSLAATLLPGQSLQRFTRFGAFVQSVFSADTTTYGGDTSSEARVTLFGLAVTLFEQKPIAGSGTASYEALSPRYLGPSAADQYPHNSVLQIGAEFGLIGLALFAGLVALALTRGLPTTGPSGAVRVTFVFFLLNSLVSGDVFQDRMLWVLALLLLLVPLPEPDIAGPTYGADAAPEPNANLTRRGQEVWTI